jgi:hypothetical protein
VRKSEDMQVAYKFIKGGLFIEQEKFFHFPIDHNFQIAYPAPMLDGPFHAAFSPVVMDAIFGCGCAEAFAISKKVNRFQEVRLPLSVPSRKQIGPRRGGELQFLDVAVIEKAELCKLH